MAKTRGAKKVSKPRSARADSEESTFSKEGSVGKDDDKLLKESSPKSKISDVEEDIDEAEMTEDSDSKENDSSEEFKPILKTNEGDRANIPEGRFIATTYQQTEQERGVLGSPNKLSLIIGILVVIGAISSFYLIPNFFYQSYIDQYAVEINQLKTTIFKDIPINFPNQKKELWVKFFAGIKRVNTSEPTRPAVFLLLHNNSADVANCLAWNIGKAASTFLKTPGVIEVLPEEAKYYINNELISDYKDDLKRKGVMIVYKLDELSGLVAKSFHSFCDTYNPLVNRAVLLFTINDFYANKTMTANKKAQELMKTLWKDKLLDSTLDALITRLTDTVLEIKTEKHVSCS